MSDAISMSRARADAARSGSSEIRDRRTALITGASSGIGAAFAEVFAAHGFNLVITARREDRLRDIAHRITREHGARVEVIAVDLTARDGTAELLLQIERRRLEIDAVVNSAGFGAPGKFVDAHWPTYSGMLQLMVTVPTELIHRLLPGMIERRYGRIVNVASLAGLVDSGAGALYTAAKRYLVQFSSSLARELSPHGIHVTSICPGLTRTEFHQAPGMSGSVYGMPTWMWIDASVVAREGFDAVMTGRRVVICGRVNWLFVTVLRYIPRPLVVALGRQIMSAYRRLRR